MPTRWSQTLIPTARQAPADATVPSHQLLLRAGYIHPLAAGVYDYLPLGKRSLEKAIAIVRRHMDPIAAEVFLPSLQPIDLWERTQRRQAYGDNLFVVTDRHGRESALGPTHEEVITHLVGNFIKSYRDLPKSLYQVQTKFRDEFRPRFGLLRTREFQMKDAYSFHLPADDKAADAVGGPTNTDDPPADTVRGFQDHGPAGDPDTPGTLSHTYEQFRQAYHDIFRGCGVPAMQVEAEAGPIGGDASHEFMCPTPTGEDTILVSDKGNYAANVEKAETGNREWSFDGEPTGELEEVETPDCTSIEDVCQFFKKKLGTKLKPENTLKTLVFQTGEESSAKWVLAIVRGDHEVNEAKLNQALKDVEGNESEVLFEANEKALRERWPIGYVGPHHDLLPDGRADFTVFVDCDAAQPGFWVVGANKPGFHAKHFNWKRDLFDRRHPEWGSNFCIISDIRNAVAGDPSPLDDGGVLEERKGIELGHIFKLGDKYTRGLDVTVAGEDNQPVHPLMGCYGIGVNRILAAAIERDGGHDDAGIVWPVALAPYHVVITPIKYDGDVRDTVDRLAAELETRQIAADGIGGSTTDGRTADAVRGFVEVLIDDRDERPGPKFKDADLIGIPVRITVGDKGLTADTPFIEVKARDGSNGDKGEQVPVDQAIDRVVELLGKLA